MPAKRHPGRSPIRSIRGACKRSAPARTGRRRGRRRDEDDRLPGRPRDGRQRSSEGRDRWSSARLWRSRPRSMSRPSRPAWSTMPETVTLTPASWSTARPRRSGCREWRHSRGERARVPAREPCVLARVHLGLEVEMRTRGAVTTPKGDERTMSIRKRGPAPVLGSGSPIQLRHRPNEGRRREARAMAPPASFARRLVRGTRDDAR